MLCAMLVVSWRRLPEKPGLALLIAQLRSPCPVALQVPRVLGAALRVPLAAAADERHQLPALTGRVW